MISPVSRLRPLLRAWDCPLSFSLNQNDSLDLYLFNTATVPSLDPAVRIHPVVEGRISLAEYTPKSAFDKTALGR